MQQRKSTSEWIKKNFKICELEDNNFEIIQ